MDWNAIGAGLGGVLVGAVAMWRRRLADSARIRAEAAVATKDQTIANAESTLYALLVRRVEALEAENVLTRQDLEQERRHRRELETHIFHLENLMRGAGLQPPERIRLIGGRDIQ
jgi:hypothetical protein